MSASPSPPPADAEALHDCRLPGLRHGVACGVVRRPLDPARPDGAAIAVHYVVAPALARRKLPDPVFLLAGGPGQSAIALAPALLPLFARLNNRRDIVFVDQRGTGRSAPLECDDATSREPLAGLADTDAQVERLRACARSLARLPHGDLRFYTTPIAMQDLDAVRRRLGAERINLVGASYGTRAALDYQRQFPQAVRRSVLDGVAPPDMALPASMALDAQAALDAAFAACRDAPECAADHPGLRERWAALLASLPKPATAADALSGRVERFTLTRERLLGAVRGLLYAPATAATLPVVVDAAASGRYEALVGMDALRAGRREQQPAIGMHFSVVCAEDLPRLGAAGPAAATDFGREGAELYERVCADWPRGALPAAFYSVPTSATPVLLLSGGADPATPPRHAERVAAALGPKARHVVVAHAGHGVMAAGCAPELVFRFIDAADDAAAAAAVADTACLAAIPRPPAFRPVAGPERAAP